MQDGFLMDSQSHLGLSEESKKWIKFTVNPDPIHAYLTYGKLLIKNVSIYKYLLIFLRILQYFS